MSAHTKGRLIVRGYSIYSEDGRAPVADTCLTASHPDNDHANAKRLAACWNACEGISTEALKRELYIQTASYSMRKQAEDQRDELLEALLHIEGVAMADDPRDLQGIAKTAREAIAKATK